MYFGWYHTLSGQVNCDWERRWGSGAELTGVETSGWAGQDMADASIAKGLFFMVLPAYALVQDQSLHVNGGKRREGLVGDHPFTGN
jgi:hypothetical protein